MYCQEPQPPKTLRVLCSWILPTYRPSVMWNHSSLKHAMHSWKQNPDSSAEMHLPQYSHKSLGPHGFANASCSKQQWFASTDWCQQCNILEGTVKISEEDGKALRNVTLQSALLHPTAKIKSIHDYASLKEQFLLQATKLRPGWSRLFNME